MSNIVKICCFLVLFQLLSSSISAQVIVNGRNPRRYVQNSPTNAISVSYGYILWHDKMNVQVPGYSSSRAMFRTQFSEPQVFTKSDISLGITVGYQKNISERFSLRGTVTTTKLNTGMANRFDLETTDKSRYTQFGAYSQFSLFGNPERRLQLQWLIGPELINAKKDVWVYEYVENENSAPETYRQHVSVVEVALVTGAGASYKISNALSIYSEGMLGVSFPGKGFKSTNSAFGIRYHW